MASAAAAFDRGANRLGLWRHPTPDDCLFCVARLSEALPSEVNSHRHPTSLASRAPKQSAEGGRAARLLALCLSLARLPERG